MNKSNNALIVQMRKAHKEQQSLQQQVESWKRQLEQHKKSLKLQTKGGYKGRKKTMRKIHRRKKSIRR
jgi:hypothetical protein